MTFRHRPDTLLAEKKGFSVIDALPSEFAPTIQALLKVHEFPFQMTFQEDDQEEDDAEAALKPSADDPAVAVREKNPDLDIHYYEEPEPDDGMAHIEALASPVDLDELDVTLGVAMDADRDRIRRLAGRFRANLKLSAPVLKRPEHVVNA
ncbi:hypothetical protein KC349_g796 [Hortaea werneckii]|nr:hypothetical protein KC349_g796 [Hortaea werneckii]